MTQSRSQQNILLESLIMSMVNGPNSKPLPTGDATLDGIVVGLQTGLNQIAENVLANNGIYAHPVTDLKSEAA